MQWEEDAKEGTMRYFEKERKKRVQSVESQMTMLQEVDELA